MTWKRRRSLKKLMPYRREEGRMSVNGKSNFQGGGKDSVAAVEASGLTSLTQKKPIQEGWTVSLPRKGGA